MHATYAGDLDPEAAWDLLAREPGAVLVDVRTEPEWAFVGVPDVTALGKRLVTVQWNEWPTGRVNPRFLDELRGAGVEQATSILFICRSGHRSQDAAVTATRAGLGPSYNVAEGFEGYLDPSGHRGDGGWRARGLPWRQS
jgi:rhodanese-related sulfurtransferase